MSKTILVATADDNEPEESSVEEQDDEQEELDTRDYSEYRQEPIQLRRSKPKAADVAPNTDRHPPRTSKPPKKRSQARTTDTLKRPRLTLRQRVGSWIQRNLMYMGIGMIVTLCLWVLVTTYVIPFWATVSLHWTYGGDVPITQYDANVGHHGTSHFLAEYWHGEVIVMEFPGKDPTKARTYVFPLNTTHDTTHRLITLHVQTINLHGQQGKPDVVVGVEGYIVSPILYNTGDAFTTSQP